MLISGDVQVLRSAYTEDFGLKNRLLLTLLSKRKELFQQQCLKSSIRLAVKVRTVDQFLLKNNLGEIRATANTQITGTVSQPKINGRVRILSGSRVYFLGRRYDVESGTVDFYGTTKLQPTLNITLSTMVQDYTGNTFYEITLPIVGPLDKLEYQNPRAVPSLSDDQIYSLLLTGSTAGAQGATSPSLLFQREMVAFLSGQLLFGAEDRFARTFGLSRIDVQQNLLATGDSAGAKLIVGKDIGENFSLTYSFPLNDPNQQTWIVSYRYRRDFIFRAIRQEDDSYTASARHTVLFGKGVSYKGVNPRQQKRAQEPRIDKMTIQNDSPVTTEEIKKKIKLSEGDLYDYWKFQDHIEELEKYLQDKGYLYPSVRLKEEDHDDNTISLTLQVSPGTLRSMSFTGAKIKGKQIDQFKKWWREGISESLVLRLIQDNLLQDLWVHGYHEASVKQTTVDQNGVRNYQFEISPGVQFVHSQIEFTGNSYLSSEHLLEDIILFYDSREEMISEAIHDFKRFKEKVEAAYIQQGLLLSNPESGPLRLDAAGRSIVKQVSIEEGPFSRIEKIAFVGIPKFPPELQQELRVKEGDVVDLQALPGNEDTIREYYELQGYREMTLESTLDRKEGTPNLILTYDLKLGSISRIASIEIRGNEVTRTELIEKRLRLKVGEVLTDRKIIEARKRLYDLGVFQLVRVETEKTDQPGEVDLLVRVVDAKKYEVQYGPRYNSESGIGAEVNLVDHNFLGHAHRGSFYGRYDTQQPVYRFDYFVPSLSGIWSNTLFSLFYSVQDEKEDEVFQGERIRFTLETTTAAFQVQQDRRFKGVFRWLYGFEFGRSDIGTLENIPEIPNFSGSFFTLSTSVYMDTRNDPLNAKRGMFASVEGQYAPNVGTDVQYLRNFDQFFYYKKLGPIVWASGVRAGFLKSKSDEFTLNERFQTGGGNSVRGFRNDALTPQTDLFGVVFGGNAVFILNQEIRFPIYKWFGGAIFYDGGNVYQLVEDFDPANIRNTGGFGFRIDSSYIVLRFDVGFNFSRLEGEPRTVFHFGIGQAF